MRVGDEVFWLTADGVQSIDERRMLIRAHFAALKMVVRCQFAAATRAGIVLDVGIPEPKHWSAGLLRFIRRRPPGTPFATRRA